MEYGFWLNTAIYYISIASMIQTPNIPATLITGLLFIAIPSSTESELIPGMRDSMNTQLEILETQMWLSREGYYNENIQ